MTAFLLGVVLDTNVSGNFKVGTKGGVIQGWLARTAVEFVKHRTLSPSAVPSNELTIRSAVRSLSIGNGQGDVICQCRGMCLMTKRCFCFKAGNLCNSACHPRLTFAKARQTKGSLLLLFEHPRLKLLSACYMKRAIKICLFHETGKAFACFMKYAISPPDS